MPEPIGRGSTPAAGRRRPRAAAVFLAAVLLLPVLEIAVAIQVGRLIGGLWTVLLIVLGCLAGAVVIRREGRSAFRALDDALRTGHQTRRRPPADSALVLFGGLLLLTPGFVSDVLGLVLLLPFTRPVARRLLSTWVGRSLERAVLVGGGRLRPRRPEDVVQGEVVDVEVLEIRDLPPAPERPAWGSPDDDEGRPPRR